MATNQIKKVDTPIDQRETFVSLQKSFADSGISVEEKLATLYDLQQVDNAIEEIRQLRGNLPEEVAVLEEEIDALNSKLAHLNDLIDGYNAGIEDNKQKIVEFENEIEKYRSQIENIANSREFDSIDKEIENLDLLRQIAQKTINESKDAIADRKYDIERIQDRLTIKEGDLEAKKAELASIVDNTATEEAALEERRASFAAKIDDRTMSAYNRIRASVNNHLAVVTIYGGDSCGGCFSTITPQRLLDVASGKKLVICEHCGRIIVAGNEE